MAKPGDIVRFLNSVGGGRVTRVEGNLAYVEDEDGFETPVLTRECVVVGTAEPERPKQQPQEIRNMTAEQPPVKPSATPKPVEPESEVEVEETAEGEQLNVTLAYQPQDLKALSRTRFDVYLVNDSNYYLYFSYLTCDEDGARTTRYAGIVEPNIQLWMGEICHEDVAKISRIGFQAIAFKRDKQFEPKHPVDYESRFDAVKFHKLHCFRDNVYFDEPVIAYEIVRDDKVMREVNISPQDIEEAVRQKRGADKQYRRKVVRRPKSRRTEQDGKIVVDLHINELLDDTRGMSPADILNYQIDEFRKVMDENLSKKGTKIVFIHGKGEGVLRKSLLKELSYRYKRHDVQDASFKEYGFGATQVTIR